MPTIQKRNDAYRITVSAGYDGSGKQIRRTMTWKPAPGMTERQIKKELDRQAVLFEEKVHTGQCMGGNIKFQDFAEQWFKDYGETHLREKTLFRYRQLSDRTYTAIGHIRIDRLQPHHLLAFYANLAEPGVNQRTGGGLSPKTIRHYHTFISSVMERAVKWNLIETNPCHRIDPPKVDKKEIKYMDDEQVSRFIDALQSEPLEWRAFFMLLLYTGMRRGEALGLEWEDVDMETGVITIRRTSQYTPEKGTFTDDTKTETSKRSIRIPDDMVSLLKQHYIEQSRQRLRLGTKWEQSERLFTQWNGVPMCPNSPYTWLQRFLDRHGLERVNLHSIRHTNATLLIGQGVNVRTVAGRLGHSQTSTTMNIYAHQLQSADAAAADALAGVLARSTGRKQA